MVGDDSRNIDADNHFSVGDITNRLEQRGKSLSNDFDQFCLNFINAEPLLKISGGDSKEEVGQMGRKEGTSS